MNTATLTKAALIKRLQDIEWEDFEVKETRSALPKGIWETVSAFSNTAGGWIIMGVRQNGKTFELQGVANPEKIEQDFVTTLRSDKFNVKIRPSCRKYYFDEGTILAFYIPVADSKPVYYNALTNTFIRTGSGSQRATRAEIDAMYRDQAFGTQTLKTIVNTAFDCIHEQSLRQYREYLKRLEPEHAYNNLTDREFLNKLRIIIDGEATYGGLLFLGKNEAIQKALIDFRIDYLEIPGTSYKDAEVRYTYRIGEHENLWQYYYALMDRLRRTVDLPFRLTAEGFASSDYPYLGALREAVVNLLMHTDYFSPCKARIRVFDNRIEFFNPGALPKPLEKIRAEDISLPRNPIIAKLFRVVKLAENPGYGFDKMEMGWKTYNNNIPDNNIPAFIQGQDYMKVVFQTGKRDYSGGAKGGAKGGAENGLALSDRQREIYRLIRKKPSVGYREVAADLGINPSASQKHFDALKAKGIIKRKGPAKGGYWLVLK